MVDNVFLLHPCEKIAKRRRIIIPRLTTVELVFEPPHQLLRAIETDLTLAAAQLEDVARPGSLLGDLHRAPNVCPRCGNARPVDPPADFFLVLEPAFDAPDCFGIATRVVFPRLLEFALLEEPLISAPVELADTLEEVTESILPKPLVSRLLVRIVALLGSQLLYLVDEFIPHILAGPLARHGQYFPVWGDIRFWTISCYPVQTDLYTLLEAQNESSRCGGVGGPDAGVGRFAKGSTDCL